MMLSMFLFFLLISVVLFFVGFYYSGGIKYGSQWFKLASAFLIFMCGLIVLTDGVEFRSGSTITELSANTTIITYDYYEMVGTFEGSYGLSALLIILGMGLFVYSILEIKNISNAREDYNEEED